MWDLRLARPGYAPPVFRNSDVKASQSLPRSDNDKRSYRVHHPKMHCRALILFRRRPIFANEIVATFLMSDMCTVRRGECLIARSLKDRVNRVQSEKSENDGSYNGYYEDLHRNLLMRLTQLLPRDGGNGSAALFAAARAIMDYRLRRNEGPTLSEFSVGWRRVAVRKK
jgi:hypothetical protein